jgi:hypothetical protein
MTVLKPRVLNNEYKNNDGNKKIRCTLTCSCSYRREDTVSELRPPAGLSLFIPLMLIGNRGGLILTEQNRRTRRKTCPSATLSTKNSTRTDRGSNPDLRGDRSATNCLNHGTAFTVTYEKKEIRKIAEPLN